MTDTLFDRLDKIYRNYIAPTKKELKVGRKEIIVANAGEEKVKSGWFTDELSPEECGNVAGQCPLFKKGVKKRTRDSLRTWFYLENWKSKEQANDTIAGIIWEFENRTRFKQKFDKVVENAAIYGNGYLIISFLGDRDKETGVSRELHQPPKLDAIPYDVRVLTSEHIKELDYYPSEKKFYKERQIMHFHYEDMTQAKDYWIHPDRIIHVPGDTSSAKKLGKSKINLLRNTIKSKVNVDIATGEILSWFAHGAYDVSVPGLNENKEVRERWEKILKSHPGGFVHDNDETIESVDPKAISPKAFYDWIVLNIAAALVMPTHVLTGIQTGRVTGSEIGFGDYYKDIKDTQDLEYSPIIANFYKKLLQGHRKPWKYNIVWNTVYIDESAETEIMKGRSEAILNLRDATVIDVEDARQIYNRGQIELDIKKKIKQVLPDDKDAGESDN